MTIELTSIERGQWNKIAKVVLWLAGSILASAALAFVTSHPGLFATTAPLFNLVGVLVQQLLQKGEDQALAALPAADQPEAKQLASKAMQSADKAIDDLEHDDETEAPENGPGGQLPQA